MVVISAAVCTKAGKILVSRQFVEISKLRVEGLLAAFPKLLNPDQEHTFIETENVRYVYQPLESLYMLLITNKSSNIMEDLDTLHLLAKLVPEYCGSLEESRVQKNAFELIFAMDEVIVGGNKEKVSLGQIKTLTEMDSHEERIHEIVERNKAREAAEQAKLRMKEIDMQKKAGRMPAGISSQYSGGGYSGGSSASSYTPTIQRSEPARTATSAAPKKGMQLKSKTSQSTDFLKALKDAGEIVDTPEILSPAVVSNAKAESKVQKDNIHLDVEERISMVLNQDGGVEQLEIKGEIRLEIKKQEFAHIFVKLANTAGKDLRIRTHPNINKPLFSKQNILALKDTSKAFPVGPALGILKWTYSGTADSDVPLNITCWPTPGGDMTTVNLEFNLNDTRLELLDVTILVPIPDGHSPVVESVEGSYEYDVRNSVLAWKVPLINADNNEGALEFTIPYSGDASRLFPVQVFFNSTTLYSGVSVKSVNSVKDNEQELKYSSEVSFSTDPSGLQVQWC